MAADLDLPIVIERLDFAARKRELEGSGAGYARMLSSLAYAAIQTMLRRRAARAGVELVEVNPAYTSVIGRVNYAQRYGLPYWGGWYQEIISQKPRPRLSCWLRGCHRLADPAERDHFRRTTARDVQREDIQLS